MGLAASPALAQDNSDEDEDEAQRDTVVVTGSRIQRTEFTSISPVQVIDGEISRDLGLIDTSSLLQDSTVATGQQIDTAFSGFVLDNGPGATTINLRNLNAARTLVMVNGRRVGAGGVEGAPSVPDTSLLPNALLERVEVVLDGASSVYGSDAVAGVVNVITRNDIDGWEFEANLRVPEQSGGTSERMSIAWGGNHDRGYNQIAIEYFKRDTIRLSDRDYTALCDRNFETSPSGGTYNLTTTRFADSGMRETVCKVSSLVGRMSIPEFGSVYYVPGVSNTGIPNFNENGLFSVNFDTDGDGFTDIDWADYSLNGTEADRNADLLAGVEQYSMFATGEYESDFLDGMTFYYEASYALRENTIDGGPPQLFPNVPADNPFNPCNPAAPGGVDCGLAFDTAIMTDPYLSAFQDYYSGGAGSPDCFGITPAFGIGACTPAAFGLLTGGLGAVDVLPIVAVQGDRNLTEVEADQFRAVFGVRGDVPGTDTWTYDFSAYYQRNSGSSRRYGVRDDRLTLSLATTEYDAGTGTYSCGTVNGVVVDADCVPINMFAPSLYNPLVGDFATQEERDYVMGVRSFDTITEMSVLTGFVGGEVGQLPWSGDPINVVVGVEYREDSIDSQPDDVACQGLFFGFFSDCGASGSKDLYEAFTEVEIPILQGAPLAEELTFNASARWTEEQFYGAAWTWRGQVAYRPVDWLLFRGSAGTSFRAPNLGELFKAGQTGFLTLTDPCTVPQGAFDPISGYDASLDTRDTTTIANCQAAGIDPFTFRAGSNSFYSVEINEGGALDLDPEESESLSLGMVIDQPWFDGFDLRFSATYYDILVKDSIATPSSQFIINDCYSLKAGLSSAFCSRITRDAGGIIQLVDSSPINVNEDTAVGWDFNVYFARDFIIGDREFNFTTDLRANYALEQEQLFVDDAGGEDFDDNVGEFGFPEWNGSATFAVDYQDWRVLWQTRYLGSVSQDDEFVDLPGSGETCADCFDIGSVDEYYLHNASVTYSGSDYSVNFGVRNLFDEEPPLVDSSEVLTNGGNVPIGSGYDIFGRTFFATVTKQF